jgi:peptidoglycan/LPS O-acetylase OafA/YrhL
VTHGAGHGAAERLFGLDLLRALAVLMVLLGHGSWLLAPAILADRTFYLLAVWGVDLFFALSGFLVGGLIIDGVRRDSRWLGEFWLRRWLRTLPNYFLFLALNLVLWRAAYGAWPDFALYLVFAQNLLWPQAPFFPESWSLAIEEVFYFLAPLLAIACLPLARSPRRVIVLLAVAALAVVAWRAQWALSRVPLDWDADVRKVAMIRLDCLVYGVVAAYAWRHLPVVRARAGAWLLAGIVLLAATSLAFVLDVVQTQPLAAVAYFALLPAAFAMMLPWAADFAGAQWSAAMKRQVSNVAIWSYSLYLTHLPVIRLIDLGGIKADSLVGCVAQFLAFCAVAMAWAALNYRLIERPIMQSRDGIATRLGLRKSL